MKLELKRFDIVFASYNQFASFQNTKTISTINQKVDYIKEKQYFNSLIDFQR